MKFNAVMGILWLAVGVTVVTITILRESEYLLLYVLTGLMPVLLGGLYIGRSVQEKEMREKMEDPST